MKNSVRIGGLNGYIEVVTQLGGEPGRFLNECDIPMEAFEDEDNTIQYHQLVKLLELTAQELKKPDFGLYFGTQQKANIFGPISIAMQTAETVGDAMKCAARFLHIQSPALNYYVEDNGSDFVRAIIDVSIPELTHREMPQNLDRGATVGQEIWKQLAGDKFKVLKVEIPHEINFPRSLYENYFDAELEFNSQSIVWHIPRETYEAPVPLRCKTLHKFASSYLEDQFPKKNERLTVRVERTIRKHLETEDCSREWVSEAFNLHPKSLQRMLTKENSNFDAIKDRVRRERVTYYLCNTNASFSRIADLVGYSSQATLSRSCQRWFSKSPREVRGLSKSDRPIYEQNPSHTEIRNLDT